MKIFQPDIFDTPLIKYKRGVEKLAQLDASGAVRLFDEYRHLVPDARLGIEYALAGLISDWTFMDAVRSDPETALYLYEKWLATHKELFADLEEEDKEGGSKGLVRAVASSIFSITAENILTFSARFDDGGFISDGRAVICLLIAEKWKEAEALCQRVCRLSSCVGKILGLQACALYHQGRPGAARQLWLQACIAGPYEIDTGYIPDAPVKELLLAPEPICMEYDIAQGPWYSDRSWAGALGLLTGIFTPVDSDVFSCAVDVNAIFEAGKGDQNGVSFAAGLLLAFGRKWAGSECDEESKRLLELRRMLSKMAPELFRKALSVLSR